MESPDEYPGR